MKIAFTCNTNKDYVMINTLKVILKSGSELTIDRKETEYSIDGNKLDMIWCDCYLWAIDDLHVFDDAGAFLQNYDDIEKLFDGASVRFELEDDADEDYQVEIFDCTIC